MLDVPRLAVKWIHYRDASYDPAGCSGNLCGVNITTNGAAFLNFPSIAQQYCRIVAPCNPNITFAFSGTPNGRDEALTLTAAGVTPELQAAEAAGFGAFSSIFTGNSTSLSIQVRQD